MLTISDREENDAHVAAILLRLDATCQHVIGCVDLT